MDLRQGRCDANPSAVSPAETKSRDGEEGLRSCVKFSLEKKDLMNFRQSLDTLTREREKRNRVFSMKTSRATHPHLCSIFWQLFLQVPGTGPVFLTSASDSLVRALPPR